MRTLKYSNNRRTRSRTLPHQWDKRFGRLIATTPLTIRIDTNP